MPRIYKPVGPTKNKAAAGPTENKTAPTPAATDKSEKKGNSGEK